jgi:hypothetical protein
LNGKPLTTSYFLHTEVMNGGELEFLLTNRPNKTWGTKENDLPRSKISDNQIVTAPYFDVNTNKFKNSMSVSIRSLQHDSIFYVISDTGEHHPAMKYGAVYSDPININKTCTVLAWASGKNNKSIVSQIFYKIPSERSITVISKVHPMYTAGGADALIDNIEGTSNWKTGDWQSYYDQDFEAVIDLQKMKQVNFVGIHVLQDVSPWIIYPKELIFYTSEDGKTFIETTKVQNKIELANGPAQTQVLGSKVNVQTRYVKIKAINGGTLPPWHESAGNPTHIFIDEVIIK